MAILSVLVDIFCFETFSWSELTKMLFGYLSRLLERSEFLL